MAVEMSCVFHFFSASCGRPGPYIKCYCLTNKRFLNMSSATLDSVL